MVGSIYKNVLEMDAGNTVVTHQGGAAYQVDPFTQLNRFLILGTESGSYYVSAEGLTKENAKVVKECLDRDFRRTIDAIVQISDEGRAIKNDPALFALSVAASYMDRSDLKRTAQVRDYALHNLSKVARIGTHLFMFIGFVQEQRGWGSGLRKAVAKWYTDRDNKSLALQVVKYQNREGFTQRDVLRLCHAKPLNEDMQKVFKYVISGDVPEGTYDRHSGLELIQAVDFIKNENITKEDALKTIRAVNLPREVIPTQWLKSPEVWDALLNGGKMPMEAMIRNLGTMSKVGLTTPLSEASKIIISRLLDADAIHKSRLHPIKLLTALRTYQSGHGFRSDASWPVDQQIVAALDTAFYLAFQNVEPTGKNISLALDVSGSMTGGTVANVPGLTPRDASAALALVTASVEPSVYINGFSSTFVPIPIHKGMSLAQAIRVVSNLPFAGTDCSLPMRHAQQHNLPVDAFVIYTDSENGSSINPATALKNYRKASGRHDASLVAVGMVANWFSVADPKDHRMLDVVGFDTSTPAAISEFIAGRI